MRLIARCPHCHTLFKVVPDQLRLAQGWVRCGQCDNVFDALENILTSETESIATGLPTDSVTLTQPAAEVVVQPTDSTSEHHIEPELPDAATAAPLNDASLPASVTLTEIPLFLKSATRPRPRTQRLKSAVMGLLTLLLALTVLAQYAYFERDWIAAWHVELKPVLTKLCQPLNCTISPVENIAFIVIESATLTKLGQDIYRLSFNVKNTALINVAVPHLELTLTDLTDQTLVRRILTPGELDAKANTLQASSEWQVSVVIRVQIPAEQTAVMGYRLVAFYP